MLRSRNRVLLALAVSLAIHFGMLVPWGRVAPPTPPQPLQARLIEAPAPEKRDLAQSRRAKRATPITAREPTPATAPASLAAPPPPSAEDWQLASTYTLRNSKRYRHNWGQLVRSMMGTAVAGPNQGQVRFRIQIAPDGKIAQVEELWSTSEWASRQAWKAIRGLPSLPPTPTGKPLTFEQTISFLPYETGWPPSYKLDCLPEPEPFRNPFAWDGVSPMPSGQARTHRPPIPDDCVIDSTAETIEEEERELNRQMDQWRWGS